MLSAFKREFRSWFKGFFPYLLGAAMLLTIGIYTIHFCVTGTLTNFEYALDSSVWILLAVIPILSSWAHKRLHMEPPADEESEEAGAAASKKKFPFTFWKITDSDLEDACFYQDNGISLAQRIPAVFIILLLTILLPLIVSLLYPLILIPYGRIQFGAIFSELLAFFLLGSALSGFAICFALSKNSELLALVYTLVALLICFFLMPVSSFCASPYSGMLLFTAIIVLIALFTYDMTRSSNLALLVAVILEVLQVICFVFMQSSFEFLSATVFAKLSLLERFHVFAGALVDIRAYIYFISVALFLLVLSVVSALPAKETANEEEDTVKKKTAKKGKPDSEEEEKKPLFNGFPVALPAICLVALLALNLGIHLFTSAALLCDASGTGLFTPSEELRSDVKKLNQDTTIYLLAQSGKEDATIRSLLTYYEAMNSHLSLTYCNPDVSAEFITTYVIDSVYNNSVLFKSGDRTRYTSYEDIYAYNEYYETMVALEDEFDHAVEFINGSETTKVYVVTGHDEVPLASYFQSVLQKQDITLIDWSLTSPLPEDASIVLLYAPVTDLTDTEADNLYQYLHQGGNLFLTTRVQETTLAEDGSLILPHLNNLESLLVEYGAFLLPGILIEDETSAPNSAAPYVLQPSVLEHPATANVISARRLPVLSFSQGIVLTDIPGVTASPLLLTSEKCLSKAAGSLMGTYAKEQDDYEGSFPVAVALEKENSRIVWVASVSLLLEDVSDLSNGGNTNFLTGSVQYLRGENSVHQPLDKTLHNYGTLYIKDEFAGSRLSLLLCFVFPFLYLLVGLSFLFVRIYQKNKAAAEALEAKQREEDEKRRKEEEEEKARREAFKKKREEATKAALAAQKAKSKKE